MRFRAGGPSGGISVGVRLDKLLTPADFPLYHTGGAIAYNDDPILQMLRSSFFVVDNVSQRHFFGSLNDPDDGEEYTNEGIPPFQKAYDGLTDQRKYSSPLATVMSSGFGNYQPLPAVMLGENQVFHTSLLGTACPRMEPLYTWGPASRISVYNGFPLKVPEGETFVSNGQYYQIPRFRTNTSAAPPYGYQGTYPELYRWSNYSQGQIPYMTQPFNAFTETLRGIEEWPSAGQWLGNWNTVAKVAVHRIYSAYPPASNGGTGVCEVKTAHNRISWKAFHSYSTMCVREHELIFKVVPSARPLGSAVSYGRDIFEIEVTWKSEMTWYKRPAIRPAPGNPYYDWVEDQSLGLTAHTKTTYEKTFRIEATCFLFSKIRPHSEILPAILRDKSLLVAYDDLYQSNLGFFRPSAMMAYADAIAKHRATSTNYVETIAEIKELLHLAPDLKPLIRTMMNFLLTRDSPGSLYGYGGKYGGLSSKFNKKALRHGLASGLLNLGDLLSSVYLVKLFGWRPAAQNAQELTSKLHKLATAIRALQSPQTFRGKFTTEVPFGDTTVRLTTRCKLRVRGVSNEVLVLLLQLDSVGLAPRMQNVWAIVQWSWLIDIFTQMNVRYDVLDAIIVGHLVGIDKVVYSYTMIQDIPDEVLSRYQIEPADESSLEIKAYAREVSYLVPAIFGGYDYAANPRPLDKGLAVALLWLLGRRL